VRPCKNHIVSPSYSVPDRRYVGSSLPYTHSVPYSVTACHTITMAMKVMNAMKAMKVMKVMKAMKASKVQKMRTSSVAKGSCLAKNKKKKMGRAGSVAQEQKRNPKLLKALGCPGLGSVAMEDPRKPTDAELEAIRKKKRALRQFSIAELRDIFGPKKKRTLLTEEEAEEADFIMILPYGLGIRRVP
jgi:hypothetical protein